MLVSNQIQWQRTVTDNISGRWHKWTGGPFSKLMKNDISGRWLKWTNEREQIGKPRFWQEKMRNRVFNKKNVDFRRTFLEPNYDLSGRWFKWTESRICALNEISGRPLMSSATVCFSKHASLSFPGRWEVTQSFRESWWAAFRSPFATLDFVCGGFTLETWDSDGIDRFVKSEEWDCCVETIL